MRLITRRHARADLSFAAVSRVPLRWIEQVKDRMGWTFPWVSSHGSDWVRLHDEY